MFEKSDTRRISPCTRINTKPTPKKDVRSKAEKSLQLLFTWYELGEKYSLKRLEKYYDYEYLLTLYFKKEFYVVL